MIATLQSGIGAISRKPYGHPKVSWNQGDSMNDEKKRILLIDDEEAVLFGFRQVLMEPWVQVDTASTADAAKALMEKNVYAAAIVDLRLSNSTAMEGLDLVTLLKTVQKHCRVIVLTAYGDESIRSNAFSLGADLFLEKPVDPETLKQNLVAFGVY
ncbi:MAG: response regulator [Chitinispirillaceae bacterium]|nr:response regulator [Chitinispirillaceae bacterium]